MDPNCRARSAKVERLKAAVIEEQKLDAAEIVQQALVVTVAAHQASSANSRGRPL
ncbi:hypothetical protein [Bradyrhizobium sp. B117]|uniref:hypothetical protein n=1 Tax=Bradyrhizobium sp. B117 TaxID=3140246 RepID=UPI003183CFD4